MTLSLYPSDAHTAINPNCTSTLSPTPKHNLAPAHHYPTRSQIFQLKAGINPFLSYAAPLLSTLHTLRLLHTHHSICDLLIYEIQVFKHRSQHHYHLNTVLAATYLLCALIDETIGQTPWGQSNNWLEHGLLHNFYEETVYHFTSPPTISLHAQTLGSERFFTILERASQTPELYLNLLELGYTCLSLGFEGVYRHQPRGLEQLLTIRHHLYQKIRQQRDVDSPESDLDYPNLINNTLETP